MPRRRRRQSRPQPPIPIEVIWPEPEPGTPCSVCHHRFDQPATGRRRRTCSDACRQKRHRQRVQIFKRDTIAIARDYRRAERILSKIEKKVGRLDETPTFGWYSVRDFVLHEFANNIPNRLCRNCGKPIYNKPNTPLGHLYCSQKCRQTDRRRRHRIGHAPYISHFGRMVYWEVYDIPLNAHRLEICAHCHIPFARHFTGRPPKYCSRKCRQNAYLQRKHGRIIGYRLCDWCSSVYPAHTRWQRFCSPTCKHAWQWKTHAPPSKTVFRETCVICDSALPPQPRPRGGFRQYCSSICKGKAKRLARKQREMDRFVTHVLGGYVTPRGNETLESAELPASAPIFTPNFEPNFAPPREEETLISR